ncbi:hypothetical protein [Ruminiclostridium cellobioparum]|uniref:DUF4386 family protein n=1 Tax=Ruminiclostridium cellobioparum subsp. termitidis CT1112 TaxID=1195236 RepID=S0FLF3_RUMCE|nr:hypothetical protein [Ruminiclostridium cellobioparum]EMS72727.1 hypothetical protein CTER_1263 [Ruminiclostridium cellobioparum subsp. termitidis CT1112]
MKQKPGIIKVGGISLIISGVLFFVQYLFLLPLPAPPSVDAELMAWLADWRFNIAMADEVFFFATLLMIPSIAALYRILVRADRIKTLVGCGLLVTIIPVNIMLVIILGRLVYPVYNIELSPDIYKLIISIYYGGMHCTAIILSAATIILSFAIRKSVLGKPAANFGFLAGIFDLIGAYPWLLGTAMAFVSQLFFPAWFVILGIRILIGAGQFEH